MRDLTRRAGWLLLATPFLFLLPITAGASLLGDTITVQLFQGDQLVGEVTDLLVVPGVEFGDGDVGLEDGESIDIQGAAIVSITNGPFAAENTRFRFSNLNWTDFPDGSIIGIFVDTDPEIVGFDAADVSFGPDFVEAQAGPDAFSGSGRITIGLIVSHIPEPASAALLTLGLFALGARRSD